MNDPVEFLACDDHRVDSPEGPLVFRWLASLATGRLLAAEVRLPGEGICGWRIPSESEMRLLSFGTAAEAARRKGVYPVRRRPIWVEGRARAFRSRFPQT